jgi:hypothetical protein
MTNTTNHNDSTDTTGTTAGINADGTVFTYASPHLGPRHD